MIETDDFYAAEIIIAAGGPATFESVEVHGVRDVAPNCAEQDDANPEYFSVYLRYKQDIKLGVECVADCVKHETAVHYADSLSAQFGWPVYDNLEVQACN